MTQASDADERDDAALAAERVQLALDAGAIIGTWVWTIADDRFIADERFAQSFGMDPAAIREGLPIGALFESIHPDDRERVGAAVAEALSRGGRYRCEYRVRRSDGRWNWIVASGRVDMDDAGKAVRFPGVLMDDAERRRIEGERDRANALLQTFIEAVPGVVYAKDREGRLIVGNRGVADLLGVAPGDFIGKTDLELIADKAQAARVMATDRRIMESGVPEQVEEEIRRADGTPAVWLSTKAPMRDLEGNINGLIGASLDITDRKRTETALRLSEERHAVAVEQLAEADRRKDEFLAMLAHELRNPLAPIRTAAQLLAAAPDDTARVRQVSGIIGRQVTHMTELVDDLLDVSRVTRGLVEFAREPVDVGRAIATAIEQIAPVLEARGHALDPPSPSCTAMVLGDRHRLVQVVSNLLNNAAKFTPAGRAITVACRTTAENVVIQVSDEGIGMEQDLIPYVFELFSQAARTPDRAQGGLGIGLALVRTIVLAHGGTVEARSPGPGRGSTFTVTLPLAQQAVRPVSASDRQVPEEPRRSVLVVDDNADAAQTLAMALETLGHEVEVASDGRRALELVATRQDWDAFILDIGMPDMTGLELAVRLRALVGARPVRFIAVTGYGQDHDVAMARASGFDHHMVKPADLEEIRRQLALAG
ncbi:MAG TPA: ATP-binding protein [Xanthomonadaceae bacterium]|nr:ATP-binding protein [Xanthomonadaceae bacterium]